jgi:hypothetical protein
MKRRVRRVSRGLGAVKGFFWGFGVGYVGGVGLARADDLQLAFLAVPGMTLAGMAVGTFLGALIGSESWRPLYP